MGGIAMKIYEIDANGNALLIVKVDEDKILILNAMDGWGNDIKNKVTITNKEE